MSRPQDTTEPWTQHLRTVAGATLAGTPVIGQSTGEEKAAYLDGFCDEFQRKHPSDRPLLARVLGVDPGPAPRSLKPAEAVLWAMHDGSIDVRGLILDGEPGTLRPLLYELEDRSIAIEWRTLDELMALHALWNIATDRGDRELRERCFDAARWHVNELQPDNATNYPWAIHVFFELSQIGTNHRSMGAPRFHAETLLHNCRVRLGRPDLVSACVLLDAASTVEAGASGQTR